MITRKQFDENEQHRLLAKLFIESPWLTRNHLKEEFREVIENHLQELRRSYDPVFEDQTMQPNGQPLVINYNNRRHIFLWATANLTATVGDLGSFTFTAGNWYNISFREGLRITNTGATSVNVQTKCTNELVP